jgi:hypothetical protein
MATALIGATTYTVYGSVSTDDPGPPDPPGVLSADSYLNAKIGATAWAAGTADDRARSLVTATRVLDRMRWSGEKTSSAQPLAWPRTNVTYDDGTPVDSTVYPVEVVHAAYELAYLLLTDPTILDRTSGGQGNVKRVKAGTAEVEFWGQVSQGILPTEVMDIISVFLNGTAIFAGALARSYGTGYPSAFDDDDYYSIDP